MMRLLQEMDFHDRQARERFAAGPGSLQFDDDAYLDHETWIRPAFAELGAVAGLPVLDYGCGHGMAAVVLARRGAKVTGFDLSGGYVREANRRAQDNGVDIDFLQADGERLPFADASFARVWGNAILHHLDLRRAGEELRRVLKPGGRAVFCEPWGENPVLDFARRYLPYPGKNRTKDETPLRNADLEVLRQTFPTLRWRGFQLFAMAGRIVGPGRTRAALARVDDAVMRRVPALGRFCRYVVLTLER